MSDSPLSDNDINDLLGGADPINQIVAEIPPPPDAAQASGSDASAAADAASGEAAQTDAAPYAAQARSAVPAAPQVAADAYALGRQERTPSDQMPSLAAAHSRLAKLLRPRLRMVALRSIGVSAEGLKVMTHAKLVEELGESVFYGLVSLRPLQGQGLLCMSASLLLSVVDHMFGGSGRFPVGLNDRDLSTSERKIGDRLLRAMVTSLTDAMRDLYPLEVEVMRQDTDLLSLSIAPPNEYVVVLELTARLGEESHAIRVCFPYLSVEPIRHALGRRHALERPLNHERWMDLLLSQIKEAEVELVAELATANATVADLMSLKVGDFIELDLRQSLNASIADVPVMRCGYGVSNGRYAIRIHDFLMAPATASKESNHVQ